MTTPHHVGQIAKAEILVAHLLDTAPADTDHQRQAAVIVNQLQDLGWTPPRDLTEAPPLRGAAAPDDSPGRREFRAGLCDRYGHQPHLGRCRRCGTPLADSPQTRDTP